MAARLQNVNLGFLREIPVMQVLITAALILSTITFADTFGVSQAVASMIGGGEVRIASGKMLAVGGGTVSTKAKAAVAISTVSGTIAQHSGRLVILLLVVGYAKRLFELFDQIIAALGGFKKVAAIVALLMNLPWLASKFVTYSGSSGSFQFQPMGSVMGVAPSDVLQMFLGALIVSRGLTYLARRGS